ncbi:MAG: glycosyltransferase family 2 protein [Saprospiraceae bacterium]
MIEIPIIILNWNGFVDTKACLSALMKQTAKNFKIYLVDNGSTDGSSDKLSRQYENNSKVQLIFNKKNLGFTKGNNRILSKYILPNKNYEYVILLNNDTIPTKNWLENLIYAAKANQASIVSSKMVDFFEPHKMDNAGHMMLSTGEILPIGHGELVTAYERGFDNMGASGGVALYSTQMLKTIGIFDEHFDTGYEDAEFGIRAFITGYKCWYEPTAVVHHKMGQSIKKIFDYDYSLTIQKNILYSYFKLMPLPILIINVPFLLLRLLALLVVSLLFLRLKYFKILFRSLKETLFNDYNTIKKARNTFFDNHTLINTSDIIRKQTFFLWFDLKRVYKFFFQGKLSAIDSYGKIEEGEEETNKVEKELMQIADNTKSW